MELRYFIIRRLLLLIPTILGLTIFVFILMWAYGPANLVGPYLSQKGNRAAQIAYWENYLGIYPTDPVLTYFHYLGNLLSGNWGIVGGTFFLPFSNVLTDIEIFFPNTIQLAIGASILSILIAIPLGTYVGSRPNSAVDSAARIFSLSGYAMPAFWLAYLLILLLGTGVSPIGFLGWTGNGLKLNPGAPSWQGITINGTPTALTSPTHILILDALLHGDLHLFLRGINFIILPVLTLTYGILAGILRFVRAGMVDTSNQEFIKTARAKGVPENVIIKKHIRKNALLPTVTVMGLLISGLLGGVVVVEEVFTYYGIGYLLVQAATPSSLQVWLIMGSTIIFGIILVLTNLIVDIIYAYMDPRIRY